MTAELKSKSVLEETHRQLGAAMSERDGWPVPTSYGDAQLEYAAVRKGGAGLIDLSPGGRILVSGTEAVEFLNGLITNDMKTLAENSWMAAAFPNVQGRLIASVRVVRLEDEGEGKKVSPTLLIDTEGPTHQRVLQAIERFTLAGDFRVTDITSETVMFSLQGAKAAAIAGEVLQQDVLAFAPNQAAHFSWPAKTETLTDFSNGIMVIRATHTAEDGFDFVLGAANAVGLWNALQAGGGQPVGYEVLNTLRIEAGVPQYGVDMDETNVVTEALFDDAVSYTKGCYLGQEIIARIKYRGHVAKQLAGITFDQPVDVKSGALVKSDDDKEIGRLTSVTVSPQLKRTIALGYLKYDYLQPGSKVKVAVADGEAFGLVTKLPFVNGGWRGVPREAN